jgi:quercetin dioxygenase-like cupin family protein
MLLKKYRWSRDYESAEEELQSFFDAKHITAARWSLESFDELPDQANQQDKIWWCAEGSLSITIGGRPISLQAGDALQIPAMTVHRLTAGIAGVSIYESPLPTENPAIVQV